MTTINDLYQAAVANRYETGNRYGVSRTTLATGEVIICSVTTVAGQSVVAKHSRTSYGTIRVGEQYAKPISRAKVDALLRAQR